MLFGGNEHLTHRSRINDGCTGQFLTVMQFSSPERVLGHLTPVIHCFQSSIYNVLPFRAVKILHNPLIHLEFVENYFEEAT